MKKIWVCICCSILNFAFAQEAEFEKHQNGLIYSEYTVSKLKTIVDSLNLKYKVCSPKTYFSLKQSQGNYVFLEKKNVKLALKDIQSDIDFELFLKKYPKTEIHYKLPLVLHSYVDEDDNKKYTKCFNVENDKVDSYTLKEMTPKGKWVYEYEEKTNYSVESLKAFYILSAFESKKLSDKYAKMILYSECLIDTTTTVFKENAKNSGVRFLDTIPNKVSEFNEYIDKALKKPNYDYEKFSKLYELEQELTISKKNKKKTKNNEELEKIAIKNKLQEEYDLCIKKLEDWESKRLTRIDSLKNNDNQFIERLRNAYLEAKDNSSSNDEFEELVGKYISKKDALELKRNRRVVGGCSMDNSPRIHAKNIALLSAETAKWDVFLKAHLNILNDRFDRVSDGSYAYGKRNTYIKELEELNINVDDLLLGTSFRFENPVENHYFSSISRLGRAISESKDRGKFTDFILGAIADNDLDDYNRVLMYYLFLNFNQYLDSENDKIQNLEKLKVSVQKMPEYLSSRLKIN